MRTLLTSIAIVAAAAAGYLGGYLREHGRLGPAEAQVRTLTGQLGEARSLLRIHALYDQVLDLTEAAADDGRYARAQALSTELFDAVRQEAFASPSPQVKQALGEALDLRDKVTGALAKRDPSVPGLLRTIRSLLHPLLVAEPGAAAPAPSPAGERTPQRPGTTPDSAR